MKALLFRFGFCVALLLGGLAQARGEALSVMQFNDKLKQWKSEQKEPPPLTYTVEGRVTLYSEWGVRLKNCKVPFQSKAEIPKPARKSSNIELTGKVHYDKRSEEFTFEVLLVREVSSDVERYHEMRRKLRQQPAEKCYELGQWAKTRGEFYDDHELLALSDKALRQGFELEREELAKDNPEGLLKLVDKAQRLQLPSPVRGEVAHEAFHLLCARSDKLSIPALQELARRMTSYLPGCEEPLTFLPTDLMKQYKDRPLETYAAADAGTRRKIHRLLYSDLILRTITPTLAADGSNGFEIAAQIDRQVPEQHRLAETFRNRALAAQAADVEKLTRSQVLELADRYRGRQQNKEADHLLETWLTFKLRALDADDTEGLLELTDDYRRLLRQHDFANRLLIDAWKRNPKAADIVERLEKEGYHLDGTNWLTAAEFNSRPEGKLERAIREGRVEPGMTVSHVRRSLGEPASQARAATAGQVTEVWRYELSGSTQLVVRFVKRAGQAEITVADVAQLRVP
ncbi:MAG: hypothetical protein ACM3U2_06380 [Deltaproteobacteria bacterium]